MSSQLKRTSFSVKASKRGTQVRKVGLVEAARFRPRRQGISAHGMATRIESTREAKDRRVG